MVTRNTPPAPDDDPRFAQWVANTPAQQMPAPDELPGIDVGRPVVAAIALIAGAAGIVVALGWAAVGFAIGVGIAVTGVIVLMLLGTLLVTVGGVCAYLGTRWSRR
jgi:hypothetical protein